MENGCFAEGNAVIYESAVEKLDLSTTIVAPRSHCKIRGIGIRCTWTIGRCEDSFYNYFLWIRICTDNLTPRAQILAKTRGACRLYGLQEGKDWRLLIEKSLLGGRIHTQKAVLPSNMWFTSVTFLQKRRNVNMLDKCRIKKWIWQSLIAKPTSIPKNSNQYWMHLPLETWLPSTAPCARPNEKCHHYFDVEEALLLVTFWHIHSQILKLTMNCFSLFKKEQVSAMSFCFETLKLVTRRQKNRTHQTCYSSL